MSLRRLGDAHEGPEAALVRNVVDSKRDSLGAGERVCPRLHVNGILEESISLEEPLLGASHGVWSFKTVNKIIR